MMKKINLKTGLLPQKLRMMLDEYLYEALDAEPREYLPGKLYYTCFDKLCIIHGGAGKYWSATRLYSGEWIGIIIHGKPYPSPIIYEKIYGSRGVRAAIVVKDKGAKAFLYGNDVLYESISRIIPPIEYPVAVIDEADDKVIGVARRAAGAKPYFQNIYDLGIFLRMFG